MNVMITGATGMVGSLVLTQCLENPNVTNVIALNRHPINIETLRHQHPTIDGSKYHEVIVKNFLDLREHAHHFSNIDTVFYCLGAYTGQLSRDAFYQVNVNYPKALSQQLQLMKSDVRFCLLSGQGADRTGKSRIAFARDKGEIENYLDENHLHFHSFRPGYIYPVIPRKEPNLIYSVSRLLYPLIKLFGKNASVTSEQLAKALFTVGMHGANQCIFENADIREVKVNHNPAVVINEAAIAQPSNSSK